MNNSTKRRVYEVLDIASEGDKSSRFFDIFIMSLIGANVLAVILESVPELSQQFGTGFQVFELVSVAVFTVEYVLRIWSCTSDTRFADPVSGRVRFSLRPMLLVDLLAILPFYLPALFVLDLRFIRALRLVRLLRVLKLGRYSEAMRTFALVLRQKKADLSFVLFVLSLMLVLVSSLMYFVEHEAQPDAFSSIPAAMWWGVATLTTVGYGDIYPITAVGKMLGAMVALLGIGLFALPAGILASGFSEALQHKQDGGSVCPHCGNNYNREDH